MPAFSRTERAALADLMDEVGPAAPTLSGEWKSHHLAAHIVLREGHLTGPIGVVLPKVGDLSVARLVRSSNYTELVDKIRNGPPVWSPYGWRQVERLVNTMEFYIHHEDVRRAREGWQVRDLTDSERGQVWGRVRVMARLLVRRAPMPVVLQRTDKDASVTVNARKGDDPVCVSGLPSELALFCYGRGAQARVEFEGADDAITTLRSIPFGT